MESTSPLPFQAAPIIQPIRRHRFLLILLVVILLALIGGVVFAYTIVFEAPRAALTESFATVTGARSFHQDLSIKATLESPANLTAEGTVATEVERPIGSPSKTAIVLTGKSGGFSVGAEFRFLDETLYGKINEFPFLSFIASYATESPIGKWYLVSLSEIEHYATQQGVPADSLAKIKAQLSKLGATDPAMQFDTLIQTGVVTLAGSRASILKVNGVWSRQYPVTVNKDKLAELVASKEKELTGTPSMVDPFKTVTFGPILVTIGLFNHSLKQITGSGQFAGNQSADSMLPAVKGAISFTVTYRDINGAIAVAKPENAISLMNYIERATEEAKSKSRASAIKSRLSSIRAMAEVYYEKKKSYTNLCVKDSSIAPVLKDIEEKYGQKPTCRSNSKTFLAASPFASSSPAAWCVDSTGFSGGVDKIPTGFVCK